MPTPAAPDQPAPDFTLLDDTREPFTLSAAYAQQPVLLLFFPGAFTSVCTNEMTAVNDDLDTYDALHTTVVGLSTDSPSVLAEFKKTHHLAYTLVSDHNAEVSTAYGAKFEPGELPLDLHRFAKRAAFVIDSDGIIRYAEVLDDAASWPDFDAIQAVLADLA